MGVAGDNDTDIESALRLMMMSGDRNLNGDGVYKLADHVILDTREVNSKVAVMPHIEDDDVDEAPPPSLPPQGVVMVTAGGEIMTCVPRASLTMTI